MAPNLRRQPPRGGQFAPLMFFVEKVVRDREGIGVEEGRGRDARLDPAGDEGGRGRDERLDPAGEDQNRSGSEA